MEFRSLLAALPGKKRAIYVFERGKTVRHPHAALHDDVVRVRENLRAWGVKAGRRVAIYAPNSYHWLVHDLALIELDAISVPFTDDFAGRINQTLLDQYNIALLLIAKRDARLFPQKPAHVAFIDADNNNVRVLERPPSGDPDEPDQHSLVFSSGSAGGLKGLVISRNGVEATLPPIFEALDVTSKDRLMLFLPMSNFQQRNMCYAALWYDLDLIITDYTQLFDAMPALNPTVLLGPPVLYQMFHAEYQKYPSWKKSLWSLLSSILALVPSALLRQEMARILFRDFYKQFGNRIRLLTTGMAPIRRNLGKFFERLQLPLCESYGMVEVGSITYRPPTSRDYGSVGKPLRGVTLSFTPDNEIIVSRETPMTSRYFQCADGENERTFLGSGRIATGDMGRLDESGNLFLLGRKKELLITPGGLKVHPETIEQELNNSPDIAHSVIFLKPHATHLTCVVDLVPPGDEAARVRVKEFANRLPSAKKAAQFVEVIFADAPFTAENGMLRPNMKIDRKAIAARYL
ncbi:MAG TPA: AMP-binding protein [Rhizomicrobium sp.]|jgi:long-chain acyl-CoA synthetase|nr:AMP-binding protein [Rhizomicrobium sp.]